MEYITAEHALHRIAPALRADAIQFQRITILVHHLYCSLSASQFDGDRYVPTALAALLPVQPTNRRTDQPFYRWRLERRGHTRSHPEHGR
jgi:hypothetical protein